MRNSLLGTLLTGIPTFLGHKLLHYSRKAGLLSNYQPTPQGASVPVFDLMNAGPLHRFTVVGDSSFIVSNCVQSGGHDVLMLSLTILSQQLIEHGIPYQPIIWDFHDECLFEVYKEDAEKAVSVSKKMFDILNERLDMSVKIKGEIKICQSLADAKIED